MGLDPKSHFLDADVFGYIAGHAAPPDELQLRLIDETTERLGGRARMQITADEGSLLALFVHLTNARNAVEVGTFTGYSALAIARALPDDGRLLCCDISEEWTSIGRRYWEEAGVAGKITLRVAPAAETLAALPSADEEPIDLAFIDADKGGYATYYRELIERLRPNGVILVDNTLWSGRVASPAADDDDTVAIRAFNDMVASDERVESYILPVSDGVTLIRKR